MDGRLQRPRPFAGIAVEDEVEDDVDDGEVDDNVDDGEVDNNVDGKVEDDVDEFRLRSNDVNIRTAFHHIGLN